MSGQISRFKITQSSLLVKFHMKASKNFQKFMVFGWIQHSNSKSQICSHGRWTIIYTTECSKNLFFYQAIPSNKDTTPSELFSLQQIRITLDTLKTAQFQESLLPINAVRKLHMGGRIQAKYYTNNKEYWILGTFIKKFEHLHIIEAQWWLLIKTLY